MNVCTSLCIEIDMRMCFLRAALRSPTLTSLRDTSNIVSDVCEKEKQSTGSVQGGSTGDNVNQFVGNNCLSGSVV